MTLYSAVLATRKSSLWFHTKLLVLLLIHISGCQNITVVLSLWQWESSLYLSTHSDIILLGQCFLILQVKEALEQVFKQPYETILKNRPEFGDSQMTNALSRALPEHKRKLEVTDEFSALCLGMIKSNLRIIIIAFINKKIHTILIYTVAKGTISEGGEENLHGHKLIAQTYSAPVGVKPEVVIWEASEVCL